MSSLSRNRGAGKNDQDDIEAWEDMQPQDSISSNAQKRRIKEMNGWKKKIDQLINEGFHGEAYKMAIPQGLQNYVFLRLFRIPPDERTPSHSSVMLKALIQLPFFQKFPPHVVEGLTLIMILEEFQDNDIIFHQGDASHAFYIILGGIVEVLINTKAPMYKAVASSLENKGRSMTSANLLSTAIGNWAGGRADEDLGNCVATLYTGESFGETALESNENPQTRVNPLIDDQSVRQMRVRRASCRCKCETQLLKINQAEYNKILMTHGIVFYHDRLSVIDQCSRFRSWTAEKKQMLAKIGVVKKFNPGAVLIRQGEILEQLGIIKRGICRVTMRIPRHKLAPPEIESHKPGARLQQLLDHNNTLDDWVVQNRFIRKTIKRRGYESKSSSKGGAGAVRQGMAGIRRRRSTKIEAPSEEEEDITISTMTSNQVFGELCLLDPLGESRISIISDSVLEVIIFEKQDLLNLHAQHNNQFMRHLQESYLLNNPTDEKVAHYCKSRSMFNDYKLECLPSKMLEPTVSPTHRYEQQKMPFTYRSVNSRAGTLNSRNKAASSQDSFIDTFGSIRANTAGLGSTRSIRSRAGLTISTSEGRRSKSVPRQSKTASSSMRKLHSKESAMSELSLEDGFKTSPSPTRRQVRAHR